MQPIIRTATPGDVEAIRELIVSEGMPPMEIEEWLESFFVLEGDGRVLGCVGIERYGDAAVLRSITTEPSLRGTGEGMRLAQHALDYARRDGAKRCYLFTMTASEFFPKFGFEPCTLEDFEPAARESWQWRGVSEREQLREALIPMRLEF
jgi:N-acetylglutamate synthase-like GNAT family acetyltransferase